MEVRNFVKEMKIAANTAMHYQDGGGGISEICILSKEIKYISRADAMWVKPFSKTKLYRYNNPLKQIWINEKASYDVYEHLILQSIEAQGSD